MNYEAESEALTHRGIAAQNEYRFDDAGLYFWRALRCLHNLPVGARRRNRTRALAELFLRGGHEDISLLAGREAIRLDEELKDHQAFAHDLIFYGNVHLHLENKDEAKATFQAVVERCLAVHDYANAASASTNLATVVAEGGDGEQAIKLLTHSLEYLALLQEGFPETEFNTHATLIQVVGLYGGDPALAVQSGIAIGTAFRDRLTEEYRKALGQPMRKAVEAYLERAPEKDPDEWKNENVAWAYSDTPRSV